MRQVLTVLLLTAALVLSGCPAEKDATRALALSKGTIETEMGKHGECNPANGTVPSTTICTALTKAIPLQHVGVLALDAYCASTDYLTNQGPCKPPTDPTAKKELQTKLQTAVSNLVPIIQSIKTAAGGKQ